MKDLYGGVATFVQSWLLPSIVAVGLAAFYLYPAVADEQPFADIASVTATERVTFLAVSVLVVSVVLATASTALYRVLEGYSLPRALRRRRQRLHQDRRNLLRQEVPGAGTDAVLRGLLRERIAQYPWASRSVMPTRLGNALRAGESYGREQYGLDTVLLWHQLLSVAPASVAGSLDRARTLMNFFCGVFWLCPAFAAAAVFAAWYGGSPARIVGVGAVVLCPLAYRGIVRSADLYSAALRALVDVGRIDLAAKFGVAIPSGIEAERELWTAVSDLVAWGPHWSGAAGWISVIDAARAAADARTADRQT